MFSIFSLFSATACILIVKRDLLKVSGVANTPPCFCQKNRIVSANDCQYCAAINKTCLDKTFNPCLSRYLITADIESLWHVCVTVQDWKH